MVESLRLFAAYNRLANSKLRRLLTELERPEILTEDAGAYFGSVLGILNHIAVSELRMLDQLRTVRPDLNSLRDEIVGFTFSSYHQKLYSTISEWSAARETIDELFIAVTEEISPRDAMQRIGFESRDGRERILGIGEMLFHLFNHATHHRGQVSQILDSRGVAHDFSSLMAAVL